MQYMITWDERSQGSAADYEGAQRRILDVFKHWSAPAGFDIKLFVIRVGDWGGYMLVEGANPLDIHKLTTMLPAFTFQVRMVIPVEDAIKCELEVMDWRDGLNI